MRERGHGPRDVPPGPDRPPGRRTVAALRRRGVGGGRVAAWAANFYAGKLPSVIGKTDMDLDEDDIAALDAQWHEKENGNTAPLARQRHRREGVRR